MNIGEAVEAMERTGYDYTIHKIDDRYQCLIDPEYGMCMELMCVKSRAEGEILPLVIYAALNAALNTLHIAPKDKLL